MASGLSRLGAEIAGGVDGLSQIDLLQVIGLMIPALAMRGIGHAARHCDN